MGGRNAAQVCVPCQVWHWVSWGMDVSICDITGLCWTAPTMAIQRDKYGFVWVGIEAAVVGGTWRHFWLYGTNADGAAWQNGDWLEECYEGPGVLSNKWICQVECAGVDVGDVQFSFSISLASRCWEFRSQPNSAQFTVIWHFAWLTTSSQWQAESEWIQTSWSEHNWTMVLSKSPMTESQE